MTSINNPSSIGNIKTFIRKHEAQAKHITSSDYSHFYVINCAGYSVGIRRSKTGDFSAHPVCWMNISRNDEVIHALRSSASREA